MFSKLLTLVLLAALAACSSVSQPRLTKRYPYTLGVQPVSLSSYIDKSVAQEEVLEMEVKFDKQKLTQQLQESLRGVFEEVVVLEDGSEARVDLVLRPALRYDARVTTRGDGWLLSGICFALGTPLGWFIEDREYESKGAMDCMVSLPAQLAGGGAANAGTRKSILALKPQSQPAAMTFWDRADSFTHYLGGLVLPAVLLASESDSVGKNLTEVMGKKLAEGLAREFLNKEASLNKGDGAEFALVNHSVTRVGGKSSLTCAWSYQARNSTGLAVEYSLVGGEWKKGALEGSGEERKLTVDLGAVNPDTLVHVRLRQLGGSGAERTYTLRVPSSAN